MMKKTLILCMIAGAISCNKHLDCEQWEYYDECQAKTTNVSCTYSRLYHKGILCNKEIKEAKEGATIVLQDDENFLKTRHFLRRY